MHHRLDHARAVVDPARHRFRQIFQRTAMGIHGGGRDLARPHGGNHGFEVLSRRIAGGKERELATVEVEGQSGAGMVKVVMTCRHDVKRVTIDESVLKDDKDMLEDLVAAAVNDAVRRVESTVQEKMAGVTAGLPLPPGFKMPF